MIAIPSPLPYLLHCALASFFFHVLEEGIESQFFTFITVLYHIGLCIISALFGMSDDAEKRPSNQVCDWCRRQKVKCKELEGSDADAARHLNLEPTCQRCYRRKERCTFTYSLKKPGRPSSVHTRLSRSSRSASPVQRLSTTPVNRAIRTMTDIDEILSSGALVSIDCSGADGDSVPAQVSGSVTLPIDDQENVNRLAPRAIDGANNNRTDDLISALQQSTPIFQFPPDHFANATLPLNIAGWTSYAFRAPGEIRSSDNSTSRTTFFDTPSTTQALAEDDQPQFPGNSPSEASILASLKATNEPESFMPIDVIAPWSDICFFLSFHQPTLSMLGSVILDLISTQATQDLTSTDMLAAEARRLVYTLRVNLAEPKEGMNLIEREICHRMYWEVVAIEKTLALNGAPIMLSEMEGVPPLPMAVDDEYISEESHFPQPFGKRSYMTGFVIVTRIFRLLGQCLQRHRMFLCEKDQSPDTKGSLRWIEQALEELETLTDDVPVTANFDAAQQEPWWGIQCANIHITALCVQFACIDFRSALSPGYDSPPQRQITARKAYDILSSIPIECLASNGQSVRGKILRVVLSLLSFAPDPSDISGNVWDWWNLYHSVHFIQAVPETSD
ncbi:hypothetical protein I305_01372 [Cryptococcus gattii E566]|uniref:Zn(2)-C6 fungal-type domain-containing protein n=2 Tax=Cryptococcus gattii TaxID=37769 RepID=E6R9A7_CRYGW|nr:Hypothetical Protein CGB_G2430C [Cryptococcus gattii WM276]ADV23405.1 Hypothetical Protein CGB_G2430C [Cryptococcus gattii WM276]KIR77767.1 hypothetical protein I306_05225 [Cryptococcus gattii EJB2]KIY35798.1 hypothetical protein I305_01372 [Cryptococcus gattii E566]KJE01470.1 hypothetical protein I311_04886 [Cryptococcus gattii NT-10]